jgi:hypothetical protein
MMTSRQRPLARLIPFVAFSVIAISALHAIAPPVPASADPPLGPLSAEGGENPVNKKRYSHEDSRAAVPSVIRELRKPIKKGDPTIMLGGQQPFFRQSPRIKIPQHSSQASPMQTKSPDAPALPSSLR